MARLGQGLEQGWGKVLSKVGARLGLGLEQGLGRHDYTTTRIHNFYS